jgi:hypothetical protein
MKFLSALKKKKVPRDFYLSLILKPHKVTAILFEKTQQSLVIISTKEEKLSQDLDTLQPQQLVKAADTVISSVEGAMPDNELVEKTIFSVPYSWQSEGKISRDNLVKLKEVCDSLELKAIGFIVSAEAIVNFLHKKDGAPVSAIFVEHATNSAYVYIVKGGSILEVKSAEVGENFVKTVESLLSDVESVGNLPSKIILHDYEGAEGLQQEFLNHEWKKELNFLQIPQILILDKGFENEAVINGVAGQMGFDVMQNLHSGAQVVDEESELDTPEASDVIIADAEEFGFSQGESIKSVSEESVSSGGDESLSDSSEEDTVKDVDEPEISASFDAEAHDNLKEPVIHETKPEIEDVDSEQPTKKDLYTEKKLTSDTSDTRTTLVDSIKNMLPLSLLSNLKSKNGISTLVKQGLNFRIIVLLVGILVILGGVIYGYYNYLLKAEVIVFADSTVVQQDEDVELSTDEDTSYEDRIIRLRTVTESVDIAAEKNATGTKETGEKAKGEVVIYNKTDKPVTFEKGTELSVNSRDFVLTDDVKVASTSSFSTSFSSAKGKVEASAFGKEYNLPSGTNFTVDGQSTANYFAKNDNAFSGGTKTELTVVSKEDLGSLREDAQKGTVEKAQESARGKLEDGVSLVVTPLTQDIEGEKFSKKEGEESKTVSLTGKMVYTFGVYATDDLRVFVEQMADGEIPEGYSYEDEESDIEVSDISVEDDVVTAKVRVNATFLANVEASKLLGELKGKSVSSAEKTIKEKKGVSDVTIQRKNAFPILPSFLPFNAKNIVITVKKDG